jgi:hypothetical protein
MNVIMGQAGRPLEKRIDRRGAGDEGRAAAPRTPALPLRQSRAGALCRSLGADECIETAAGRPHRDVAIRERVDRELHRHAIVFVADLAHFVARRGADGDVEPRGRNLDGSLRLGRVREEGSECWLLIHLSMSSAVAAAGNT